MLEPRKGRSFDPKFSRKYGRGPEFTPSKLVKYCAKWERTRLFSFPFHGSCWRPRMNTIVIAVDGACKINNSASSDSRAAFGVFFGKNCRYNYYGRLRDEEPQTSSRAELEAVRQALLILDGRKLSGHFNIARSHEVIIKTDSTYVHNTFNEWVWQWSLQGGRRADGKRVAHYELVMEIHDLICDFERDAMPIRFWRVGREWNEEADELANRALI